MPRGGGAIRGIGEKLTVNPASGTATLRVPIFTSPGRSGFGPQLALTYDSGAGNGPFGLSWSLGLPAISRKTEKGLPRYRPDPDDAADTYVLSGTEDLVPKRVLDGGQWRLDVVDTGNYRIQRYRPRVEGTYARIERWEDRQTADVHWRSTTRDNVTSIYGGSPDARIADPEEPRRVFSWLIEETRDDKGNVVTYTYKPEDLSGVSPAALHEHHRLVGAGPSNRHLKSIHYGNAVPDSTNEWHFEVVFDYGEHEVDAPTPAEIRSWAARPDPFSSYRAGFEVRTYRLCRRVLVFHRFDALGAAPVLVRATEIEYLEDPVATLLGGITQAGFMTAASSTPVREALPTLTFTYSQASLDPTLHGPAAESLANVPAGVDGARYQWFDFDSEGLAGILTEQADGWFYKRNHGGAVFGPLEPVALRPAGSRLGDGAHQLADLAGDGRKQLVQRGIMPEGFFERTPAGEWSPFRPFPRRPNIAWQDPNLRQVDVDGDGLADVLITEDAALRWYPARGRDGHGPPEVAPRPVDEAQGPALVFADATQSVFLADMSGDGLSDIVRIRNGEVCYWPNLGYARFGARVTMTAGPVFDSPDLFDPGRLRLVDIDGSGTTDLLYLGRGEARFWFNQAGNGWSAARSLANLPLAPPGVTVEAVDLLGNGTACLVWSSALPADGPAPLGYIDLLGGDKPRLLVEFANNMGLTTRFRYAPSTRFYLEDQASGNPWITRLPFPVHLVAETETIDGVSGSRLVSRYRFHHGYYDIEEREFRGFGMAEQWDSEAFSTGGHPDLTVPPVRTKTWFHTGTYLDERIVSTQFVAEYFSGDAGALPLADSRLPAGLHAREAGEARRALRGHVLRQEIYADDGVPESDRPYRVTESSYQVRMLQPVIGNDPAVFAVDPLETVTWDYERDPGDPRIAHAVTLAVDAWGNVLRSLAIAYPRRAASPDKPEQGRLLATVTENTWFNHPDDPAWFRLGVPIETRTWEVAGIPLPAATSQVPHSFNTFTGIVADADNAAEVPFEADPTPGEIRKRLIGASRHYYYPDSLDAVRPVLGHVESRALPYSTYQLALTPGLITGVFGTRVTDAHMQEAGYVQLEPNGPWWIPSGRQVFDASRFYLPTAVIDPFDQTTTIAYDAHDLLVEGVTDPLGNTVRAENDYRVLQPLRIADPNGNSSAASFDALGMVVATAIEGKGEGDTLGAPTTRLEYHLANWRDHGLPVALHALARETHTDPATRWQEMWVYTDGFGREAMTKAMAEPGLAPSVQGGTIVWSHAPARWVGTGRTVYDNKGNPVKKYEPFFSHTADYEDEALLVEWGVTPILRYDPLGRLIRTDHPSGTLARVVLAGWSQTSWDENDTVLESAWYASRQGDPGPEGDAASKAAEHAGTPTEAHVDSLGRPFLAIADNGAAGRYETRADLDIQGHQRRVIDALGRDVLIQSHDLLGRPLHTVSPDAGERWLLPDVGKNEVWRWDSRGFAVRHVYDALRRPTHRFVTPPGAAEVLAELTVYGQGHANATALNLRGQPYLQCDGTGVVTHEAYDFKGNLLTARRRVAAVAQNPPDWSPLAALGDPQAVEAYLTQHPGPLADEFTTHTSYDALNRPTVLTAPDGSVVRPAYNEAGLLEQVAVTLAHGTGTDRYVDDVGYDVKGQREHIVYGNGVRTDYRYDPQTFHLIQLTTRRGANVLQDLAYTYDPTGNITRIEDGAQQTVFFANAVVPPTSTYRYDALYRLVEATGREHLGQNGEQDQVMVPGGVALPTDAQAMRNYTETYTYDAVGNILKVRHQAPNGNWTRRYAYTTGINRLAATSQPGDLPGGPFSATYAHDAHGNATRMPHLPSMRWDYADRLLGADVGGGATAAYAYDAGGERVRKVVARGTGGYEERIYLGGFERYRRVNNVGDVVLERQTLHLLDGERRIALVETATREDGAMVPAPAPLARYQLDNHLGSACLELDAAGQLISYEEYHPYGTTAYYATASALAPSAKRYRYTGKERDEESGLSYHGARYYAGWLGRWVSADPAGITDGVNLYQFVRGNPILLKDPDGRQGRVGLGDPRQELSPDQRSLVERFVNAHLQEVNKQFPGALPALTGFAITNTDRYRRVDITFDIHVITGIKPGGVDRRGFTFTSKVLGQITSSFIFEIPPPAPPSDATHSESVVPQAGSAPTPTPERADILQSLELAKRYAEMAEAVQEISEPIIESIHEASPGIRRRIEAILSVPLVRRILGAGRAVVKRAASVLTGVIALVKAGQTRSVKPIFEGAGDILGGVIGEAAGFVAGAVAALGIAALLPAALPAAVVTIIAGVIVAGATLAGAYLYGKLGAKLGGVISDFFTDTLPNAFRRTANYFGRLYDETLRNVGPYLRGDERAFRQFYVQ